MFYIRFHLSLLVHLGELQLNNRLPRNQGPPRTALVAAGLILLTIIFVALLTSCAKVEPIDENADFEEMTANIDQSPLPAPASANESELNTAEVSASENSNGNE